MADIANTTQHDTDVIFRTTAVVTVTSTRFVALWFVLGLVRKLGKDRSDET